MLQMTGLSASGGGQSVNISYGYSATQNNGRITGSTDNVSGETVQYGYDTLNRLTAA